MRGLDRFDVAVVGYGPTGMTLAALLGKSGRRVVVLERHEGLYNLPRAACFDGEIMRLFQKLGINREMEHGALVQRSYEWLNESGETLLEIEYDDPGPAGWAALYMMYQPDLESTLDGFDKSLPTVEVRQGVTVTGIDQDDEGVTLETADGRGKASRIHASYAVGADGGSGFTRRAFGGGVDDYGFQENWLVCDFALRRKIDGLPLFRQVCDPAQPRSIIPIGPRNHRFSFMLDPGVTPEEAARNEDVWSRVREFLGKDDAELIRVANYVFHSRIVRQWRTGRVFLAGDAAHEMPPFLGQGMCSGMRDAHNLAWKLDLVLGGCASGALLDSYQAEREPQVRWITEKGIELGRLQTLRDPVAARARDERLLAMRRAGESPDNVRLPGLAGGLIADNGTFFPQARIRVEEREALFDDLAGAGWRIVAIDRAVLEALDAAGRAFWDRLRGGVWIVGAPGGFVDLDGVYAGWFAEHRCAAAIVRPDWYVYGTAREAEGLDTLLARLERSLKGR